jgi:hypothetical protein
VERIRKRFVERGLERAIHVYEQAVELTPPDSPELPGYLFNLGKGCPTVTPKWDNWLTWMRL